MSAFFQKYWILLVLSFVFLATRLFNLTLLPIFTDEAIYIYWAKFIEDTHSQFFLALTDGKPVLLTWIIAVFLSLFPSDWYLVAGRLPSVVFGLMTFFGVFFLTNLLFKNRRITYTALALTVFSPFLLMYDRLALYDAQLTAMLVWSVYFAVRASKTFSYKDVLLWGFFLGLGFLSKPPALLFLLLTPVVFLVLSEFKKIKKHWKKTLAFFIVVAIISEGMSNLQRVSGAYAAFIAKNQQFQQPIETLLSDPFQLTFVNLDQFAKWLLSYYTAPFSLLLILAFVLFVIKKNREGIALFLLWFLSLLILATAGREVFPRYLVFLTPYAIIAVSYLMGKYARLRGSVYDKGLTLAGYLAIFYLPVAFCFGILTNPVNTPLPRSDYNQLIAEHPSGYGLDRVYRFLRNASEEQKVTVVTEGTFGLYPYAFYLEFWGDPNIRILPKWPLDKVDDEIIAAREEGPVFLIFKEQVGVPSQIPDLTLLMQSEKPGGRNPVLVTQFR